MFEGVIAGELAVTWIAQRFDGLPPPKNCGITPPVTPYAPK